VFLNPSELIEVSATNKQMNAMAETVAKYIVQLLGSKYMSQDFMKGIKSLGSNNRYILSNMIKPKLYVVGGSFEPNAVANFNLANGKWTECNSQNIEREGSEMVWLKGEVYSISGIENESVGSVSKLNPVTDSWTTCAPLPEQLRNIACCVHEDTIYSIGGVDICPMTPSTAVYSLDSQKIWTLHSNLKSARYCHASVSYRGQLYIAGGVCESENGMSNSVEYFDEHSQEWVYAPSMLNKRTNFKLVVMNEQLYAIGGDSECTIEMFTGNKWVLITKLKECRKNFAVTQYNNIVYIMGGRNKRNEFLNSIEMFDIHTHVTIENNNTMEDVPGDIGFVFGQSIVSPPMQMCW
jgi:hypothetical protein